MNHKCKCEGARLAASGPIDAPLIIINPCPTLPELEAKQAFAGRAGLLVWNTLKHYGFDRTNVRIIQVVCGFPEGADGQPTPEQIARCRPRFEREVREASGRAVLLLGGLAVRSTIGLSGKIDDLNGYLISPSEAETRETKVYGKIGEYKTDRKCGGCAGKGFTPESPVCPVCSGAKFAHRKGDPRFGTTRVPMPPVMPPNAEWFIPTLAPETIRLQGYKHTYAFTTSVDRAVRVLRNELDLIEESDYAERPFEPHEGCDAVAFDIETDIGTGAIERIGFSWRGKSGLVLTWTAPWTTKVKEVSRRILERPNMLKIAHNIMFDASHLAANGIHVAKPWICTMQGGAMLQPDLLKGLGRMAPLRLDIRRWKHKSKDEPAKYNALDAKIDFELGDAVLAEMDDLGMSTLYRRIMDTYPTLLEMTRRGIRVDVDRADAWREMLRDRLRKHQHTWTEMAGPVNYLSVKQLGSYLYDKLGLPMQFNKYGRVSTDEEALRNLLKMGAPKHKAKIELLLEIREASKLYTTYANVETGDDSCVHPSYVPANKETTEKFGARSGMPATGRLASNNPNIQNQPKEARKLFITHYPGQILLEADYSQLELRILAALSGDKALAKALDGDVHADTMEALGIKNRVLAKGIVYGTAYGAGPRKLAKMLQMNGIMVNEIEAAAFQSKLFAKYGGWFEYRQFIAEEVAAKRKLVNAFGRVRPFYGGRADITKALDFPPQSNGADMVWTRITPVHEMANKLGGGLLTVVHDSFLIEARKPYEKSAIKQLKGILEESFDNIAPGFKVPVVIKRGDPSWGEMIDV